jgi:O-antigen ligase
VTGGAAAERARSPAGTGARRWLAPAILVGTALALVPGLSSPFHLPKLVVLCGGSALACALAIARREERARRIDAGALVWAARAWLAAVILSALAGDAPVPFAVARELAAPALLLALLRLGVDARRIALAAAGAGAVVASVSVLQAVGADPSALVGFARATPGARLAVYGTLGNPDFVASWLAPALVITLGEWRAARAPLLLVAAALMAIALGCARSLASIPALGAAAVATFLAAPVGRRAAGGAALALLCAAAIAFAGAAGRDPWRALAGRAYLWRVAAPHVARAPLLGGGPGSFEVLWPAWEAEAFATGRAGESDRRFAAVQDHAHADLLERALETGLPGAAAFAAVIAFAVAAALRSARNAAAAAGAARGAALAGAIAALAVRSLCDFPFARPADLALLVALAAAAGHLRTPDR